MRVTLEESDPHEEGLEFVELVHEIINRFCKPQNHMTLLEVIKDRISISDSVWMHHDMVGK